jgi:hypothetical protein
VRETMVTGVRDNQQPDDLEAGERVYVTVCLSLFSVNNIELYSLLMKMLSGACALGLFLSHFPSFSALYIHSSLRSI